MTYSGFGNGGDGAVTLAAHSPVDSACGGTSGTKSLTATNASFSAGKLIKIRQERGTNYGSWEINIIDSYVAGTITTVFNLVNTYSSSGANRAQVMVIPEYSSVRISASFSIKAWNDTVGGHWCFMVSGQMLVDAGVTVSGKGRGFRGGDRENSGTPPATAESGDSPTGAPHRTALTNNGMAGGGASDQNAGQGDNGGGAGHAFVGGPTTAVTGGDFTGADGSATDTTNLVTRQTMGSGGGGGVGPGGNDQGGFGGSGGATFDIYAGDFVNHGTLDFSGNNGNTASNYGSFTDAGNPNPGGSQGGGGGAGSGGSGRVSTRNFYNDGTISVAGGIGGANNNTGKGRGGNGSVGILNVEACAYDNDGTITGQLVTNVGGQDFCQSFISIY